MYESDGIKHSSHIFGLDKQKYYEIHNYQVMIELLLLLCDPRRQGYFLQFKNSFFTLFLAKISQKVNLHHKYRISLNSFPPFICFLLCIVS